MNAKKIRTKNRQFRKIRNRKNRNAFNEYDRQKFENSKSNQRNQRIRIRNEISFKKLKFFFENVNENFLRISTMT